MQTLRLHLLSNVAVGDAYPMVLTTASTETASAFSVGLLLFPLCLMAACSLVLVSKSRTYTIQTDHILNITT